VRTRITLGVVAVLVGALLITGLVSDYLVRRSASSSAQQTIYSQTVYITKILRADSNLSRDIASSDVLSLIEQVAGITGKSILTIGPDGRFVSAVPALEVSVATSETKSLARGQAVSGVNHHTAFAAAPLVVLPSVGQATSGPTTYALVLERRVSYSSGNVWFFVLAGGISLLVAGVAASVVARRVSRRVDASAVAAGRIAAGDLDARVAVAAHDYPELAGLGASINTMAANLTRARHLQRQFLLSISHDLRTPLTSIRGYAEAIEEGAVPDLGHAAGVIASEATRLERLIGDLLDLAKLEADQFTLSPAETDLAQTVANAAEALRYEFDATGVALVVDVPARPIEALADADRIAQMLANLVENALKFAATSVEVSLTERPGGAVALAVADDGPGIDREDLPHVFERLFTSGRHFARSAGTGLGLAIVAELTEAMGGQVEVTSPVDDGRGTRITITLPLPLPEIAAAD